VFLSDRRGESSFPPIVSLSASRRMQPGQIPKCHRWSDGRARPGIAVAHHRGHAVANRVQSIDDRAICSQYACPFIRDQAALGAQVAPATFLLRKTAVFPTAPGSGLVLTVGSP